MGEMTTPASEIAPVLVGDPVLWVISDPQSGAMIELGARRRLARPIPNPSLTHDERTFEGEHSLFVQCGWVLTPSRASPVPEGYASRALESLELLDRLQGRAITAAAIDELTLELRLTFDNGAQLRVDPTARPARLIGGYTIRIDRLFWSVSEQGEVKEEQS
jgi:hypothetical protein